MFRQHLATDAASLPAALRDDLLQQARAGCTPEALLAPLLAQGWAEDAAVAAVEALLREHLAAHAEDNALPPPARVPGPTDLNAEPVIAAGDRHVQVLASLLHPRIVVFGGLLSARECAGLIAAARGRLTPSTVIDPVTGADQLHAARTSEGASFQRGETELCRRIERRIATLLDWPVENGEGLQILRYAPGAQYRPHHDYFDPAEPGNAVPLARGGQRVATLVMYLNTPRRGGATTFPEAQFEVAPIAGNAVFFSYDRPHPMTRTLHGGAPVTAGEKWIATKWLRVAAHS